ncbi:hypothetical protein HKX48_006529 [Thoreauomyces humboldtii]|nr:hypothetical protein HKX48_006529 [Thoreauomyces humboldtii]
METGHELLVGPVSDDDDAVSEKGVTPGRQRINESPPSVLEAARPSVYSESGNGIQSDEHEPPHPAKVPREFETISKRHSRKRFLQTFRAWFEDSHFGSGDSISDKKQHPSTLPSVPKVAVRHLRPGDEHFIAICRDLLLAVNGEEDVIFPRVGQDDDSDHHILSYWRADTGRAIASGNMGTKDLVGFIEYFHAIDSPANICIDKLYINTAYEGMGFSRRLIQELHRLARIETVEVWSLWHTERFYKEHGYVDVPHPKGGRVQADWGPLLIWVKADVRGTQGNPRMSIVGDGSYRF